MPKGLGLCWKMDEVSIVIPTIDEAKNMGELIPEIEDVLGKNRIRGQIIVVDDMSGDGTAEKALELGKEYGNISVVSRRERNGLGNALKEGVKHSIYPTVMFMDADLSHQPKDIPRFMSKIRCNDIVVGSRFICGSRLKRGALRKAISGAYNMACKRLLGGGTMDVTSGYRAFRKEVFEGLELKSKGPEIHSELVLLALLFGHSVCEIPISYEDRSHGQSKLNYFAIGPGYTLVLLRVLSTKIRSKLGIWKAGKNCGP